MSPRLRQLVTVAGDLIGEVDRARELLVAATGPGRVSETHHISGVTTRSV